MRAAASAVGLAAAALSLAGCCEPFVMQGTARADRDQWRYSSLTVMPFEIDPAGYSGDLDEGPEYLEAIRKELIDEIGSSPPYGPAPLWLRIRAVEFQARRVRKLGFINLGGTGAKHITLEISFIDMYGRVLARGQMETDTLYGGTWMDGDFECEPVRKFALGAADFVRKHFRKI